MSKFTLQSAIFCVVNLFAIPGMQHVVDLLEYKVVRIPFCNQSVFTTYHCDQNKTLKGLTINVLIEQCMLFTPAIEATCYIVILECGNIQHKLRIPFRILAFILYTNAVATHFCQGSTY